MKTDLFQSCGHCWVFQICWHIECSTFTASSFRIWNSSTGIPSPPLALSKYFTTCPPKKCIQSLLLGPYKSASSILKSTMRGNYNSRVVAHSTCHLVNELRYSGPRFHPLLQTPHSEAVKNPFFLSINSYIENTILFVPSKKPRIFLPLPLFKILSPAQVLLF